jgi:hypothetical protein
MEHVETVITFLVIHLKASICPSSAECTGDQLTGDQLWRCNTSSSAERHVKTVGKLLEV